MTYITFPRAMLEWLDRNRGPLSRQSFIVHLVFEAMSQEKYK
jgi:hypothetical protein